MSLVVSKAIKLVDLVADGVDGLAEIAASADMSRSTTHRLLATLVEHKYLNLESKRYTLGFRLLELGERKKRSMNFIEATREILGKYADLTSDTIHLAVLDGRDTLLIDRVAGHRQLQIGSFIGQRATACTAASGKALIAQLDPKEWQGFLVPLPLDYPKSESDLIEDLRNARLKNVAVDYNECDYGTCGIASSFRVNDRLMASCSINGATAHFPPERVAEMGELTVQMAAELEAVASKISTSMSYHDLSPGARTIMIRSE